MPAAVGASTAPPLGLNLLIASGASATLLFSPLSAEASSIFDGQYADPNHPGCLRKIESSGQVSGTDGTPGCLNGEPQKPWALKASAAKPL